jgi:hypothetical protein
MNHEDLRTRLLSLEQEVGHLKKWNEMQAGLVSQCIPIDARNKARLMALESVVHDLALHAGVSSKRLAFVLQERARQRLDFLYRMCEDSDPTSAARNDDRNQDELPTLEESPPLFEPEK